MTTKSRQDAMDTFKEILQDVDDSSEAGSKASKAIMKTIVATMPDRASTQMKFNELLKEFRTDVLKEELPWDDLSEDERSKVSRLCICFVLYTFLCILQRQRKSHDKRLRILFSKTDHRY